VIEDPRDSSPQIFLYEGRGFKLRKNPRSGKKEVPQGALQAAEKVPF
jgi:hypothetical protein